MAWFAKQFIEKGKLTLFGNGDQVRDLLYIDDLIDFYQILIEKDIESDVFNLGGGNENKISLLSLIVKLETIFKYKIPVSFEEERAGDQQYFVSGNMDAKLLNWQPKTSIDEGLKLLIEYLQTNK